MLAQGEETASAEVYDARTDSWQDVAPMPAPACAAACAVDDNCFIFAWGSRSSKGGIRPTAKSSGGFYRYNPDTNTYDDLGALPMGDWFGFAVCAHAGVLYAVGGIVKGKWTSDAWAYYVDDNAWEPLSPMSYVRRRTAACVVEVPLEYIEWERARERERPARVRSQE
jgi:N-acetylneuraminic acid mutarotase